MPENPELEAAVAELEAALEAAHAGIVVLDREGRVVRHNRRALEMFALSSAQLQRAGSKAFAGAIPDRLTEAGREPVAAEGPGSGPLDTRNLVHVNGGRVYQRFIAPHRVGGATVGHVVSFHDVSDWVRVEQALQQRQALLEKAQTVGRIGSWVEGQGEDRRHDWSPETCRIFGVPPTEYPGTLDAFLALIHPDDVDLVRHARSTALSTGQPYEIDHRIVRSDGAVRWVRHRADVVQDGLGKALRLVGTLQDITERRRLEEQLRQSLKLEAIGRLAAGVSHDVNNALTAVVGYTELALSELEDDHPARPDVAEIRRAAERAESVTRQLLAFGRQQTLEPRTFQLNDTIARLGRLLEGLLGAAIDVRVVTPASLPPIHGDPGRIEQAIVNLSVNARDAMPEGGRLTLAASVVEVDEATARANPPMVVGRYVQLAVTDTGVGMTPETKARLFEPFFTTKGPSKGTGLGLATAYGTIKQSGGWIFVDSEAGRGSTFRLYFPIVGEQATAPRPPAVHAETSAAGVTVLVVEDDSSVQNLVVAGLSHQGYRVLRASSGPEALALDGAEPRIDLLLTDASMPGMSGLELARTLASRREGLLVIIMSGLAPQGLRVGGQAASLLLKPFTSEELRQKVREVLGRGRRAESAGDPS